MRAAIEAGGAVTFDCDGTIVLTNTLVIEHDTTLDGSGHDVVISGNGQVRIFQVNSGVTFAAKALTIANGKHQGANGTNGVPGGDGFGAGVLNLGGTINLIGCTLSNHLAQGGDGTTFGTTFGTTNNGGQAQGAAICSSNGVVNLTNCLLVGNSSISGTAVSGLGFSGIAGWAYGGALFTAGGSATARGCTFAANVAAGADSGDSPFSPAAQAGSAQGGAIYSTSSVVSVNATFFQTNAAVGGVSYGSGPGAGGARGGALTLVSGSGEILRAAFVANVALGGGGIRFSPAGEASGGAIDAAGELRVADTRFLGNRVEGGLSYIPGRGLGGAISARVPLVVSRCEMDQNEARGGRGVSVSINNYAGTNGCGGAIYSAYDLAVTNVTLFANRAFGGDGSAGLSGLSPGGAGQGGGVCVATGAAVLVHGTVFANTAQGGALGGTIQTNRGPAQGAGVAVLGGSATLYNSILASNICGSNCFGTIIDGGHNISSDSSCPFTQSGSLTNTDPKLGPLADYGGPTPTVPLLAGSPALDAAASAACPLTDQRGMARPYGGGCDIGAFESAPPYTIRGQVQGYLSSHGTTLSDGMAGTSSDTSGYFAFNGLSPGTYTITPSAQDAVFVLSNQVLTVGPDIVNADFRSYRSNAWTVVGLSNSMLHLVLAGAAGQTYRAYDSTNLTQWSVFTNVLVPSSGVADLEQPVNQRARFFKSSGP